MKCPLCLSDNSKLFHRWPNFSVLDCKTCGFRFTDLQTWSCPYDGHDYYAHVSPIDINTTDRAWIDRRLKILLRYSCGGRSIDIGSGFGEVPIALKKLGFDSEGLDESKNIINLLNESHPNIIWHSGLFYDVLPNLGQFDVISLYHVLEHVPKPLEAMRAILKSVRPGGIVVIEVPNVKGLIARLMGSRWHYYLRHHVNYFGPVDLARICAAVNCQVLEIHGDYDFTYPIGAKWRVAVKSALREVGFRDVITLVMRA